MDALTTGRRGEDGGRVLASRAEASAECRSAHQVASRGGLDECERPRGTPRTCEQSLSLVTAANRRPCTCRCYRPQHRLLAHWSRHRGDSGTDDSPKIAYSLGVHQERDQTADQDGEVVPVSSIGFESTSGLPAFPSASVALRSPFVQNIKNSPYGRFSGSPDCLHIRQRNYQ